MVNTLVPVAHRLAINLCHSRHFARDETLHTLIDWSTPVLPDHSGRAQKTPFDRMVLLATFTCVRHDQSLDFLRDYRVLRFFKGSRL